MMSKKNHLKGAHEKNYALFCDMMQRGWEMEKIAENLDMKMITVKSYKYLGRYKDEVNMASNAQIDADKMMSLVHELESKYDKLIHVPDSEPMLAELRQTVGAI